MPCASLLGSIELLYHMSYAGPSPFATRVKNGLFVLRES